MRLASLLVILVLPFAQVTLAGPDRAEIVIRIEAAEKLRAADPKAYVAAMEAVLGEAEGTPEVGMAWLELGNFTRFRLRDPQRALGFYGKAEGTGMALAIFAQADTWQFDLRDKARALAEYRRNLERLRAEQRKADRGEARYFEWGARWLAHQVTFLETGRRFSGTVDREDVAGAGVLTMLGAAPPGMDDDPGWFAPGGLAEAPASAWTLMRAAPVLGGMPEAKGILAFLERNDPAGYASACFFGLVDLTAGGQAKPNPMFGGSLALQEAKAQFLRERKITLAP